MGVSPNSAHFGCPENQDYSVLGSILGLPYFGKPPNTGKATVRLGLISKTVWFDVISFSDIFRSVRCDCFFT